MKSPYSMLLSFALLLPATSTLALPIATPCPNCTAAQAQSTALTSYRVGGPGVAGQSTQYVYDLPGNQFWAIYVDVEPNNTGVGTHTIFRNLAVSPGMQATFANYHSAWLANNRSEAFHYTVPISIFSPSSLNPDGSHHDDGFINAFDILTIGATNYIIVNCLADSSCTASALQGSVVTFLSQFKSSNVDFQALNVTITVKFHDGSEVEYKLNTQTGNWEMMPGTAYDSHHNRLDPFLKTAPQQYLNGGNNNYDGNNILQLLGPVRLLNGAPYCAVLSWDGVTLTCAVAGG